jgi:hypothetical protein
MEEGFAARIDCRARRVAIAAIKKEPPAMARAVCRRALQEFFSAQESRGYAQNSRVRAGSRRFHSVIPARKVVGHNNHLRGFPYDHYDLSYAQGSQRIFSGNRRGSAGGQAFTPADL